MMNFLDHLAWWAIAASAVYFVLSRRMMMTTDNTALATALDRLSTEVRETGEQVAKLREGQGDPAVVDAAVARINAAADALDALQDHPVVQAEEPKPEGGEGQ